MLAFLPCLQCLHTSISEEDSREGAEGWFRSRNFFREETKAAIRKSLGTKPESPTASATDFDYSEADENSDRQSDDAQPSSMEPQRAEDEHSEADENSSKQSDNTQSSYTESQRSEDEDDLLCDFYNVL